MENIMNIDKFYRMANTVAYTVQNNGPNSFGGALQFKVFKDELCEENKLAFITLLKGFGLTDKQMEYTLGFTGVTITSSKDMGL